MCIRDMVSIRESLKESFMVKVIKLGSELARLATEMETERSHITEETAVQLIIDI